MIHIFIEFDNFYIPDTQLNLTIESVYKAQRKIGSKI